MKRALAVGALLLAAAATAQDAATFDGYTIYTNAFNADFLGADVARSFGLSRAANRGLVNVTVIRKGDASGAQAEATVAGTVNVEGHAAQPLAFRPIRDASSLSYMAEFDLLRGQSNYSFELTVKPLGSAQPAPIHLTQALVGP